MNTQARPAQRLWSVVSLWRHPLFRQLWQRLGGWLVCAFEKLAENSG